MGASLRSRIREQLWIRGMEARRDRSVPPEVSCSKLVRFAEFDVFVVENEVGGASFGAAHDGDDAVHLFAGDEAEGSAGGAGEDGPVGIHVVTGSARVYEDEDGA